jgi:RNA recognition motif-containing protein
MDEGKSTHVYVSNLPSDFTDEDFKELMSKYGLIMFDPLNKKPKLKLYRNADGTLKGDGLCCYIKVSFRLSTSRLYTTYNPCVNQQTQTQILSQR